MCHTAHPLYTKGRKKSEWKCERESENKKKSEWERKFFPWLAMRQSFTVQVIIFATRVTIYTYPCHLTRYYWHNWSMSDPSHFDFIKQPFPFSILTKECPVRHVPMSMCPRCLFLSHSLCLAHSLLLCIWSVKVSMWRVTGEFGRKAFYAVTLLSLPFNIVS